MEQADLKTTLTISPCCRCGNGIQEDQNFCRWCGAGQKPDTRSDVEVGHSLDVTIASSSTDYTTARLDKQTLYHPVSAPLVRAVVQGVPNASASAGTLSKRMLLVLMTFPIWVMIILLSPLDAYTSAKVIARRI